MAEVYGDKIPVVTIDGPGGTGKGTIAKMLSNKLNWKLLDSGLLYRLLALKTLQEYPDFCSDLKSLNNQNELDTTVPKIADLGEKLDLEFTGNATILDGIDVSKEIRTEKIGNLASKLAVFLEIRSSLIKKQLMFRVYPGLVADGRDMGTVIFKDADLKIYLDASTEERAKRRYFQLKSAGLGANMDDLVLKIRGRDLRDKNRDVAPLKPAEGAFIINTDNLNIEEVFDKVLSLCSKNWFT